VAEFDSVIPAGGSGKLVANIKTSMSQHGNLSKSISVVTDAEDAPSFYLRFTIEVHSPITARPRFGVVINGVEGEMASGRVLLHRVDGGELEIEDIETSNASLAVVTEMVTEKMKEDDVTAEPGDVWIQVVADQSMAATHERGSITLATNDPMAPRLVIPFSLRILPIIEAQPDVVRMWPSAAKSSQGRVGQVSVRRNREGEFTITSVEVSNPKVFSALLVTPGPAAKQTVRVSLADDMTREKMEGSIHGWIKIGTDDPERPTIEIPVIVAPTRKLSRQPPRSASSGDEVSRSRVATP
jgi:hypothetical protein